MDAELFYLYTHARHWRESQISIILGNYVAASGRVDTKTFENSNCGILNSRNLPFKAISPKQEHVSRLFRCVKSNDSLANWSSCGVKWRAIVTIATQSRNMTDATIPMAKLMRCFFKSCCLLRETAERDHLIT